MKHHYMYATIQHFSLCLLYQLGSSEHSDVQSANLLLPAPKLTTKMDTTRHGQEYLRSLQSLNYHD